MAPRSLRVLIVEDSESDEELLRLELRRAGYAPEARRVSELADLRTALHEPWDIILSDYHLRGFTAIDALAVVRQAAVDLPFIVVSGSTSEETAIEVMRAGARDYFRKERLGRLAPAIERELAERDARRELREAEAKTRAVEQRLYDTVNAAPIPIAVLEGERYQLRFRNPAHLALFGSEPAPGVPWVEAFPEHSGHVELFERARRTGEVVEARELRAQVPQRDGAIREAVFSIVVVPFRGPSGVGETPGGVLGVTALTVDTTREVELRQRTEQARRDAEHANRVKDEFLSTLSHELRTPLNSILGWTLMLRSGTLPSDKRSHALDSIERSAREQTRVIEDLLDISRIIKGKLTVRPRAIELRGPLERGIESLRVAAEAKRITLDVHSSDDGSPVLGDPDRLQQVIWNLLSNAIKFTPSGGRVSVRMQQERTSLVLVVADTGIGIDPLFLPHVFERFRQADSSTTRSFGGLGLGLAIAKQIVELHGGTLEAFSGGAGKGTTMRVTLPARRMLSSAPPKGEPLGSRSLSGVSVLVVDDDDDACDLLTTALESCGALVRAAKSATEAVERVHEAAPDVLVSDIGLPGEDGYSMLRRIRAITSAADLPAIALTARADDDDARAALLAGFQLHIPKPADPRQLALCVGDLARSRH